MMTQASMGNRPTETQHTNRDAGKWIMPYRDVGKKEQRTVGTKHRHLGTQTNRGTGIS